MTQRQMQNRLLTVCAIILVLIGVLTSTGCAGASDLLAPEFNATGPKPLIGACSNPFQSPTFRPVMSVQRDTAPLTFYVWNGDSIWYRPIRTIRTDTLPPIQDRDLMPIHRADTVWYPVVDRNVVRVGLIWQVSEPTGCITVRDSIQHHTANLWAIING